MSNTQKKRREMGLCPYCGNTPLPGKTKCAECTEKFVRYKKTSISKMSKSHCKTCGGKRDDKYKTCSVCRARIKEWRDKHKDSGNCDRCGAKPIPGNSRCLTCYLKGTSQQAFGTVSRHSELLDLFNLQEGRCPYSGLELTLGTNTSLDHKIPKSKGGADEMENLQWTHKLVNQMKWDTDEEEFLKMVMNIASHRKPLG